MKPFKATCLGCLLVPVVLVGSCAAKMQYDAVMYNLPGETLSSPAPPSASLKTAMQVAETLDSYVQPRFEILRDRNFGAFRITYKKHAGVVQLKVDSEQEKRLIANANAAKREYVICLLHCAPKPPSEVKTTSPKLQILYFNRRKVVNDMDNDPHSASTTIASERKFDFEGLGARAVESLPQLMKGGEVRASDDSWDYLMRPVRASKQACLNCHTGAKAGSTLGVMVYAVRKTASKRAIFGD